MFGLCFLTSETGRKLMSPFEAPYPVRPTYHQKIKFSEIAGVVTSLLLTVDALSIINLLKPGHHYFIFEATATLTMLLSLDLLLNRNLFYGAFAVSLIFLIVVFKNFTWRNVVNGQVPWINNVTFDWFLQKILLELDCCMENDTYITL